MERHFVPRAGRGSIVGALCLTTVPAFANDPTGDPIPPGPTESRSPASEAEWGWSYEPGEGLTFASADDQHSVTFGGRIMNDWAWMTADDGTKGIDPTNPFVDGTEFRRAWFEAGGTLYDVVHFKAQYEFSSSDVAFRDLWIGVDDVIATTDVRVGHFKEPFSLEELTSSKYITFMERALPNAIAPAWNTGFELSDAYDCKFGWQLGVFRDAGTQGASAQAKDGAYNATGRVHWAPVHSEDASSVVHLGFAGSMRRPEGDTVRIRTRPEVHLAPYVLDTRNGANDLMSDGTQRLGAEAAWVNGPLSLQGEYVMEDVSGIAGTPDVDITGFYAFVSYFLTGEVRPYKASSGAFGRVKPKENYGQGGGGAWEVGLRYSNLDIDAPVAVSPLGGTLDDITLGANWYLNPNARVMFNYVWGDLDSNTDALDGDISAFMMRFQVDF